MTRSAALIAAALAGVIDAISHSESFHKHSIGISGKRQIVYFRVRETWRASPGFSYCMIRPIYQISMPSIATSTHCFWVYSYWIFNVWVSLLRAWIFGIWTLEKRLHFWKFRLSISNWWQFLYVGEGFNILVISSPTNFTFNIYDQGWFGYKFGHSWLINYDSYFYSFFTRVNVLLFNLP